MNHTISPRRPFPPAAIAASMLVAAVAPLAAQTPVISYDWATQPVAANQNFARGWTAGTTVDRKISFSDSAPLSPASNYAGPAFYGGASFDVGGTLDGTTPAGVSGTPVARVSNGTSGDETYISITSGSLVTGGTAAVSSAALYYFKAPAAFPVGDTSLRFVSGSYANLSRFQWVLRDAAGTLYVSDMSIKIPSTGTQFLSNNLTTRKWAVLDPGAEDLANAAGAYHFAAELGLDFTGITGAGVLVTQRRTWGNSGTTSLNASIRVFEAYARDPARDAALLSAYYFGNSLTGGTAPTLHGALGASAGQTWDAYAKLGAGWQLWQHRYELYTNGHLDPGPNGDLTLDPELIGDSATQIGDFIAKPWESMVLQPFGMGLERWVTEMWGVTFSELTDVGDIRNAADIIDVFLAYDPAGKTYVYVNWPDMPSGVVPPKSEWPEWTLYYSGTLVVGQTSAEFPNRDAFDYDTKWFDFYQVEDPPWTNNRGRVRDYYIKMFDALIALYPDLWAQGRLTMIPAADVFRRLGQIYRAGGDPELNNPAVPEKIDDIKDFYTDRQHIRAGMAEFTAAACFYTALYQAHPGALDWTIYNIPTDYASNPPHDRFPTLQITAARAAQVCDVIWEIFANHPYTGLRVSPFQATGPAAPDTACLWGTNGFGQLGKENRAAIIASPEAMADALRIFPGGDFALALRPDGSVLGWGRNTRGQLGDATFVSRAFPYETFLLPPAQTLACGRDHAAAVTAAGEVWAWGANDDGQLGDDFGRLGHTINGFPVPPENGRARKVGGLPANATGAACGDGFTVAVFADGAVWAWGKNDRGQLGTAPGDSRSVPAPVAGLPAMVAVAAGDDFALALAADGTVWAWGANDRGQLGLGDQTDRPAPVPVAALSPVAAIAAGAAHTLAVTGGGTLYAWGENADGQLGSDPATVPFRVVPTVLDLGIAVRQVAAGTAHSLALLADRSLRAWGANGSGQLGDGTTVARWTPAAVPAIARAAAVRAAGDQTAVVTAPPRPTFAAWQAAHFTAPEIAAGQAADTADFEGDNRCNLLEYIQRTNPRAAGDAPVFGGRMEGGQYVFEAEYVAADDTVAIAWETSADLRHWQPAAPAAARYLPDDDLERAILRFDTGGGTGRFFLRQKVTRQPAP